MKSPQLPNYIVPFIGAVYSSIYDWFLGPSWGCFGWSFATVEVVECGSSSTISSGLQDTRIEISVELGDSLQQVATRIFWGSGRR